MAQRVVPDPFVIAIILTLLTFGLDIALTGNSAMDSLEHWHKGFWELLTFGMQMSLILVTGYALADAPVLKRGIQALSNLPQNTAHAACLTVTVTCGFAFLHWGLGLIVGALLAAEMGRSSLRRKLRFHYPLLGAAGYAGLLVWHGGISGSAPVKAASAKDLAEILGPELSASIGAMPLSSTVGSIMNLGVGLGVLLVLLALCFILSPDESEIEEPPESLALVEEAQSGEDLSTKNSLSAWLENGPLLVWVVGIAVGAVLLYHFQQGRNLSFNLLNLIFLAAGLVLHGSPLAYGRSFGKGVQGASGIILQFPFYGGIMGMMKYGVGDQTLVTVFADSFVAFSTPDTLPIWTFFSAGLVNLFVPSGGGQWAVQGPVVMQAAVEMGASPHRVLMGLAYGDQWTNMLQPFWALALLGITGLKANQIVGYTFLFFLGTAPVFLAGLYLLPL